MEINTTNEIVNEYIVTRYEDMEGDEFEFFLLVYGIILCFEDFNYSNKIVKKHRNHLTNLNESETMMLCRIARLMYAGEDDGYMFTLQDGVKGYDERKQAFDRLVECGIIVLYENGLTLDAFEIMNQTGMV